MLNTGSPRQTFSPASLKLLFFVQLSAFSALIGFYRFRASSNA